MTKKKTGIIVAGIVLTFLTMAFLLITAFSTSKNNAEQLKQSEEENVVLEEEKEQMKKEFEGRLSEVEKKLEETNVKLKESTDANTKMADRIEMTESELVKSKSRSEELKKKLETKTTEYEKSKKEYEALKVSKAKEKVVKVASETTVPSRGKKSEGGASKYVEATAYTAFCDTGCTGVTATGVNVSDSSKNYNIIAVDPRVIPLHSLVEIEGHGVFRAMDTGGAIKGNKIDILVNSHEKAISFGRKQLKIRIIRSGK